MRRAGARAVTCCDPISPEAIQQNSGRSILQLVEIEQAFKEFEERSGDPPDLPPHRRAHRSPHLRGIPGLLLAGHPQAAATVTGAGTDAEVGPGKDGRDPDGRCAPANHGRPHRNAVAPYRTRGRSLAPASAVEVENCRLNRRPGSSPASAPEQHDTVSCGADLPIIRPRKPGVRGVPAPTCETRASRRLVGRPCRFQGSDPPCVVYCGTRRLYGQSRPPFRPNFRRSF